MTEKSCFVVSPIGEVGSKTRRQADCVFEYIIKPALQDRGYADPLRVDREDKPSHITTEIITRLVEADLVVADLSGLNANVFYELGIRHAYRKPTILLSDWEVSPPFDVAGINIIKYIHDDPSSHEDAIGRIRGQLDSIVSSDSVSNPVTVALGFQNLSEKGDDLSELVVSIASQLERLQWDMAEIKRIQYFGGGRSHIYAGDSSDSATSFPSSLAEAMVGKTLDSATNPGNALRKYLKLEDDSGEQP